MNIRKYTVLPTFLIFAAVGALNLGARTASSQNWSSSYAFPSANDKAVSVQQAQAIRNARNTAGPTTVVNNTSENYNDNRSNYVESNVSGGGGATVDYQIGDSIGQNTNAIGAMNTGTTNVRIDGDGNYVSAINSAESQGCIDGSVNLSSIDPLNSVGTIGGVDLDLNGREVIQDC